MKRKSYLSPQFRNLRTEQIGPSSHKNEYRNGVLCGNWQEERYKGDNAHDATKHVPGALHTSYKKDFGGDARVPEGAAGPAAMHRTPDLGRELLFGHSAKAARGEPPATGPVLKGLPKLEAKKAQWKADVNPDSAPMLSTKAALSDSVGKMVQRDASILKDSKVASGHSFSASFVAEHSQVGLRTAFPLTLTPLASLGKRAA